MTAEATRPPRVRGPRDARRYGLARCGDWPPRGTRSQRVIATGRNRGKWRCSPPYPHGAGSTARTPLAQRAGAEVDVSGFHRCQHGVVNLFIGRVRVAGQQHIAGRLLARLGMGRSDDCGHVFPFNRGAEQIRQVRRVAAKANRQPLLVNERFQVAYHFHTKRQAERELTPAPAQRAIGHRGGLPVGKEFTTYGRTARFGWLSELVPARLPLSTQGRRRGIARQPAPDRRGGAGVPRL